LKKKSLLNGRKKGLKNFSPSLNSQTGGTMSNSKIGVGLACFIRKQGKILTGIRAKEKILAIPGGHLEFGESFEQGGLREIGEECGTKMSVRYRRFKKPDGAIWTSNNYMRNWNKHYITIWIVYDWVSGEPENLEPDKCMGWEWKGLDEIVSSMPPSLLQSYWSGAEIEDEQYQWMPLDMLFLMKQHIFGEA
jgi:8-oxo-dGTP diphosphatase